MTAMDSNPLTTTNSNNAQAQSTDWALVREFYLTCRSYKQTAEHFGLNPDTIKKRCQRENWKSRGHRGQREGTTEGTNAVPLSPENGKVSPDEGTNSVPLSPENSENVPCDVPPAVPSDTSADAFAGFPALPMRPNLMASAVNFGQPWQQPVIAHDKLRDKAAYRSYICNPATKDCLFSGIRGMNKLEMVSRENQPAIMLAVVADYDLVMTEAERMKKTAKLVIKPNFISSSYSGGTHAVWFLQTPIPLMPNADMVQALLETITRKLKLKNAYGPLDAKAFYNASQYYHAGWNWQQISAEPIPESMSLLWLDEAMKKSKFTTTCTQIPLERIREEMKKRGWDKRWQGEFELGARGVRFWDPLADCPTAAIVKENGMICFTGPFPFQSWADIFGSDFMDSFKADTFGKALSECYMVNNSFYACSEHHGYEGNQVKFWMAYNRQIFELLATEKYGLSNRPEQEGEDSPLKQAMAKIVLHNSLPAACPFIYRKDRIIYIQGEPRLNTSFLRVHEPDLSKGQEWGDGFPWIAAFMERLFPDIIQRERFMAAWAYAYRNAYKGEPKNGHTLFVAGPVGSGKNFLSECLYGASMGGSIDASEYILGKTRFNDYLMGMGVWTLNDTVAKGDYKERSIFAKALKKMAANYQHTCEGKYKGASGIFWSGRIIVTLNTDPDSLQLLPDIELSNRDKISLFKTADEPMNDADGAAKARAEMGALCSYLLNWEIPEHCVGDARWGVRNYLHPDLVTEAANSSPTASFRDILILFAKDSFEADKNLQMLAGSATWYYQQMTMVDSIKEMLRGEVTNRSIGRRMGALASTGQFPVYQERSGIQRSWCIERKAFMEYLNTPVVEGEVDEFCPF